MALRKVQKPARYTGGELNSVIKEKDKVDVRFAFCFPDTYEVGMSHLGGKILYSRLNSLDYVWCERVFAPWFDFEEQMKCNGIHLYGLESGEDISKFDFIGFSLMYEMSYSNVLNMLDLAGIPIRSADRTELSPIIIFGGPCTCNPEPMAPFADIICLGEGEEVLCEVADLYRKCKKDKLTKQDFLIKAARIEGIYVPSFYDVDYKSDGTVKSITPNNENAPKTVRKRVVADFDKSYFPENFVVPYLDIVHDRAMLELFRGCVRGCRFCQAGFIYRPIRERKPETLNRQAAALCETTGYDEISLSSLSTSDYRGLPQLLPELMDWTESQRVSLSLPSLRVDNFSRSLMEKISSVRKSGLTFAPEAGTQRLRDAINKNVSEEEIFKTCRLAFEGGWTNVKLYFMLGLPTETMEDVEGIAELAQKIVDTFYSMPGRPKGKSVNVTVSVATFVPKPFTPFQWEVQDTSDMVIEKQNHLRSAIKSRKISLSCHENHTSFLEAVFARGDRRLADVIETAWRSGCHFDSWDEGFKFEKWISAFENCDLDPAFYANRKREYDEIFPWDHIFYGVNKKFLQKENEKAYRNETSLNCREACAGCGASTLTGGICSAADKSSI
ncbi:MAG TPA: TIGR03960 family B12-binding radical SAM protein [Ruminiclostridium sp.]|nr:TIGR03960 family B12-binding radical SAM protein [Ruminiclostridium sp.]